MESSSMSMNRKDMLDRVEKAAVRPPPPSPRSPETVNSAAYACASIKFHRESGGGWCTASRANDRGGVVVDTESEFPTAEMVADRRQWRRRRRSSLARSPSLAPVRHSPFSTHAPGAPGGATRWLAVPTAVRSLSRCAHTRNSQCPSAPARQACARDLAQKGWLTRETW